MDSNVTKSEIKRAYIQAAQIIDQHGEQYLPLFERIEHEYNLMQNRSSLLTKAKELSRSVSID